MSALINLPGYEVPKNALLDLGAINGALDFSAQQNDRRFQSDLAGRQMQMAETKFGNEQQDRTAEKLARGAFVIDQIDANDPRRQSMWQRLVQSDPRIGEQLGKFGVDANDHVQGPKFIISEAGKYDPTKELLSQAQRKLYEAQAGQARAHAGYYNAAAEAMNQKAQPQVQPTAGPLDGYGLDSEGNLIDTRQTENRVLGSGATVPGTASTSTAGGFEFGPSGQEASNVPGIVIGKGRTDQAATAASAGQRAVGEALPDAQARLFERKRNNDLWTHINGNKPPSGMYYGPKGELISLKPSDTASERQGAIIAKFGLKSLDDAERIFKDSNWIQHITGGVGGLWETGRGYLAAEMAITDLNFALSGKSVSNAEREHFLRLYMPKPFESVERRNYKLARMREYFSSLVEERKKGASDEKIGQIYRSALSEGGGAPAIAGNKPDPIKAMSNEDLLRELSK